MCIYVFSGPFRLPLRWPEQKPSSLPEKMEADETARCLCTIPAAWSYPNQSTAGQACGLNPVSTTSPPTGNHYRASTCQTSCLTPTQRATSSRRLYRRRLPVVWKPAGEQLVVIHRKKNQVRNWSLLQTTKTRFVRFVQARKVFKKELDGTQ